MAKKAPAIPTFKNGLKSFQMGVPTLASQTKKVKESWYETPEWRALAKQIYKERPRACAMPGCLNPHAPGKRYLDHTVEVRDDPSRMLDKTNIVLCCAPCHSAKTWREKKKREANKALGWKP